MEMLIGCIFLVAVFVILMIFCKNVTFTIKIEYPVPEMIEVPDIYNEEGDPKEQDTRQTIDDVLRAVNSVMLDQEEDYE